MCHRLDNRFFERLAGMDPAEVCARTGSSYDAGRNAYRVPAMDEVIEVDLAAREIRRVGAEAVPVTVELGLAVIFYLMQSDGAVPTGRWVSEKDLKGGVQFFRGPHAIPTRPIAEACHAGLNRVLAAGAALGGRPIDMGDAAFACGAGTTSSRRTAAFSWIRRSTATCRST